MNPEPVARPATPEEKHRAAYLFRNEEEKPPPDADFVVAVRTRPIERFVAAAGAWRADGVTHFLLARQPGLEAATAADVLIPALEMSGSGSLRYGRLLADTDEWAPDLLRHGFARTNTERVFEATFSSIWNRVDRMLLNAGKFPESWRLVPISECTPETVWPLVAPFRLVSLHDLRKLWLLPPPRGYARDWSVVLFDRDEPIGAFLTRRNARCVAVDVRVVKVLPGRRRALANLALLSFVQKQTHRDSLQKAVFRADEIAHRETANLARRLGGTEVGRRHCFEKARSEDGEMS